MQLCWEPRMPREGGLDVLRFPAVNGGIKLLIKVSSGSESQACFQMRKVGLGQPVGVQLLWTEFIKRSGLERAEMEGERQEGTDGAVPHWMTLRSGVQ